MDISATDHGGTRNSLLLEYSIH